MTYTRVPLMPQGDFGLSLFRAHLSSVTPDIARGNIFPDLTMKCIAVAPEDFFNVLIALLSLSAEKTAAKTGEKEGAEMMQQTPALFIVPFVKAMAADILTCFVANIKPASFTKKRK